MVINTLRVDTKYVLIFKLEMIDGICKKKIKRY